MTTTAPCAARRQTPGSVRRAGRLALCALLAACAQPDRQKSDTTAIVFDEPRDALASREECQNAFDAARTALVKRDVDACLTSLTDAARFFRDQSRADAPEARPALQAAAEELETLAANVANGRRRTAREFDRAFARAHAAEAQQHLVHARAALLKDDTVRAGEELIMTADHLERAAKDAKRPADPVVRTAIADTRSLAGEMMRGMAAVPDEASKVSTEIESAIRRIVASVYVPLGPEPLTKYD